MEAPLTPESDTTRPEERAAALESSLESPPRSPGPTSRARKSPESPRKSTPNPEPSTPNPRNLSKITRKSHPRHQICPRARESLGSTRKFSPNPEPSAERARNPREIANEKHPKRQICPKIAESVPRTRRIGPRIAKFAREATRICPRIDESAPEPRQICPRIRESTAREPEYRRIDSKILPTLRALGRKFEKSVGNHEQKAPEAPDLPDNRRICASSAPDPHENRRICTELRQICLRIDKSALNCAESGRELPNLRRTVPNSPPSARLSRSLPRLPVSSSRRAPPALQLPTRNFERRIGRLVETSQTAEPHNVPQRKSRPHESLESPSRSTVQTPRAWKSPELIRKSGTNPEPSAEKPRNLLSAQIRRSAKKLQGGISGYPDRAPDLAKFMHLARIARQIWPHLRILPGSRTRSGQIHTSGPDRAPDLDKFVHLARTARRIWPNSCIASG